MTYVFKNKRKCAFKSRPRIVSEIKLLLFGLHVNLLVISVFWGEILVDSLFKLRLKFV